MLKILLKTKVCYFITLNCSNFLNFLKLPTFKIVKSPLPIALLIIFKITIARAKFTLKYLDMAALLAESSIETIAGGFAGLCQVLIGHPFDTLKVTKLLNKIVHCPLIFTG